MQNHSALADAINARMLERGMTQRELAERSGLSIATLQRIRDAQPQRRSAATLAVLSRALGWPDDHLRGVFYGEVDDHSEATELRQRLDELTVRVDDLASRVDTLERRPDGDA